LADKLLPQSLNKINYIETEKLETAKQTQLQHNESMSEKEIITMSEKM